MNIKFRKLTANEIEVRVAQVSEKYTQLLLYKTARTDMDILDETVNAENWQCEYETIKDNLYCKIGIWDAEKSQWIWKQDCGVESRENDGNEKKGEASDAFKRAGFKWGIGRELYTAPKLAVLNDAIGGVSCKEYNGKKYYNLNYPWQSFYVRDLQYDNQGNISKLRIVNNKGVEVWSNLASK
jgi:hypothetical protein